MDVAELARQISYKVAPEPLIAVQGLANTFAFDTAEERLEDPAGARAWLVESGLASEGVRVGPSELKRLLELRDAVRDAIDANLAPKADPRAAARLAALARERPIPLAAGADGELQLDLRPAATVNQFVAQVVAIVYQSQLEGQWPRLKICAFDECRWAFYDSSRNRGGTWCQMNVCGNRVKNRVYRRRRARA